METLASFFALALRFKIKGLSPSRPRRTGLGLHQHRIHKNKDINAQRHDTLLTMRHLRTSCMRRDGILKSTTDDRGTSNQPIIKRDGVACNIANLPFR